MTKRFLSLAIIALASVFSLNAQSIVGTEPTNRNALLEEFTGRNCGYCPDGHRIANQIAAQHPGRFWAINLHAGGFSPTSYPNLNTPDGNIIHNYFSISGYPCGTVNRASKTPSDRGQWANQVNNVLSQQSCVNVGAIAVINPETRTMHIDAEVYYTSDSDASTNKLSIALVQNNILGSQSGGSTNPDQWINGQYNHMHILRDMITSPWGETIEQTTEGSFHALSFDYEIPESIGNPNGVEVVLEDLEVLIWVAEENLKVITANEALLFIASGNTPIEPQITTITQSNEIECSNALNLTTSIVNVGTETMTSVELYYDFNGVSVSQTVACDIAQYSMGQINATLPAGNGTEEVYVTIAKANGVDVEMNDYTSKSVPVVAYQGYAGSGDEIVVKIWHDKYGNQVTWKIFNSSGEVVEQGGPYSQLPGTSTRLQQANIALEYDDCYRFVIYDSNGDGINNGNGAGHYQIEDANGNVILSGDGVYTDSETTDFHASLQPQIYININPTVTPAGAGSIIGAGEYIENTNVAVLAVPNNQYAFLNWTVNGEVVSTDPLYIVAATQGVELVANFKVGDGIESVQNTIDIYPNPATSSLSINNVNNISEVTIYNVQGQVMMNCGEATNINISNLAKGMYIIRVVSEEGTAVKKFVKE